MRTKKFIYVSIASNALCFATSFLLVFLSIRLVLAWWVKRESYLVRLLGANFSCGYSCLVITIACMLEFFFPLMGGGGGVRMGSTWQPPCLVLAWIKIWLLLPLLKFSSGSLLYWWCLCLFFYGNFEINFMRTNPMCLESTAILLLITDKCFRIIDFYIWLHELGNYH